MAFADVHLDDRYRQTSGRVFLSGTQALARLPMLQRERDRAAGLNTAGFISGYRGSPLGGLDKTLWQAAPFLKEHQIHFMPGINEDLAATAVWGSQQVNMFAGATYDGVFAMWYGKAPGVDRSGDVFKHGNHAGSSRHGGVLLIAGDDHGCKSSTLPSQTEYAFVDAMIPVLNPSGVQEIIDLGLQGWALSRFSGCWVALKTIAETVDGSFSTCIDPERVHIIQPDDFEMPEGGLHCRWPDKPLEQEQRLHHFKLEAALAYARANRLNRLTLDSPSPRFGIVSTGKSYLDVLQALEDLGIDEDLARSIGLRVYKVGMSWPLEPAGIRDFASGLEEVLVVEEKRGLIEDQLTSQLYNWNTNVRPVVVGKHDEKGRWLLPARGELTPAAIARVIASRIDRYFTSPRIRERLDFLKRKELALATSPRALERTPHFCSGCPHNTSTRVPEGSRSGGGIGCHYMATWMERNTDTFTQMGGEGVPWIGQSPFTSTKHVFQNLGDGTYFHSGLLAIRATVSAGVNITYKILYNDAVAMTGGQTIDGQLSVPQMAHQLRHEGIARIAVVSDDPTRYERGEFPAGVTFDHRDDLDRVQCELREVEGTSILIYDQTCAAEKRRRLRVAERSGAKLPEQVRAFINPQVCEGCGDCGEISSCLSLKPLETEYGRKREIDQGACNLDLSCVRGFCPSFVTVAGARLRKPEPSREPVHSDDLPTPVLPSVDHPYGIVLTGVGGTGVITLGAILGTAAHIEGKGASVLDMTGLAQKFGPVISHVQVAADPDSIRAARIAAGGARLLLGCDLVVAASFDAIAKVDSAYATAVINTYQAVTAEFTRDPDLEFPSARMRATIQRAVGRGKTHFVDATTIVERTFGNALASNIFMLGYAWQKGLVPISEEALSRAIELNGRDVELNRHAFLWGRRVAHDPSLREAYIGNEAFRPLDEVEEVIHDRRAFLARYQDTAYADRYEALVRRVESAERALGDSSDVTLAVARNYARVLAFKDEYEVARLYTDGTFEGQLNETFSGDYRVRYHLAPPLLARRDPHTGIPRKIAFGGWMRPVLRMLAAARPLRGTWFDLFRWTDERRLDRDLIDHYQELMETVIAGLARDNHSTAVALANLPAMVRGFGHVRARNLERAMAEENALLAAFKREVAQPVELQPADALEEIDRAEAELVDTH